MAPLILGNPHLVQKLAKEAPEIEEALARTAADEITISQSYGTTTADLEP